MADIPAEAAPTDCNGSPHFYAYEHGPYSPVFVGRCTMCGAIDWPDLAEQVSRRIAEAVADAGVGSPVSCPSAAPESTQSPEIPEVAPVYPPDPVNPAETLSALRGRYADAIDRVLKQPNGWAYRGTLPDAVLAVRDDELSRALRIADYHANQHRQAEERADRMAEMVIEKDREATQWADWLHQAEAAIARVHQVCRQALATPDAPDRWAVAAQVRAALEGPEPQVGAGAVPEEHTGGGNG